MNRNYSNIALFIMSLMLTPLLSKAKSSDTLRLDLALNDPGSIKSIQGNRNYDAIVLVNVVAGFSYSIEVKSTPTLLDALNLNDSGLASTSIGSCPELEQRIMNLKNFQAPPPSYGETRNELNLSKFVSELRTELRRTNCVDKKILEYANSWLETTQKVHQDKIEIGTGDKITIIVKRDTLVWTFIFNGNERGQWVTTYGFGFTSKALEGATYFAKQISDTTVFQIQKARRAEALDLNYVPAIFFSYFPSQKFSDGWNHSLTAGLGFDLSAPVVFLGYNGLFYHNIGFSAGIAFQQQYRLKDQYSQNEIVSLTLDHDQLHDKVYRPNLFVAINFRFGENPFKTKDETGKEQKK